MIENPDEFEKASRTRMALYYLKNIYNFDPSTFTDEEVIDFTNIWNEYIALRRTKGD